MNKLVKNPESVNKELKHNRKYCLDYHTALQHIKISACPFNYFKYYSNFDCYKKIWTPSNHHLLNMSRREIEDLKAFYQSTGIDDFYYQHGQILEAKYENTKNNYVKKNHRPDYTLKQYLPPRFQYIATAHNMRFGQAEALYSLCKRMRNPKTMKHSQKEIGEMSHISRQYVNICFKELKEDGYLEWTRHKGKENRYTLTEKAKDFYKQCFNLTYFVNSRREAHKYSVDNNIKAEPKKEESKVETFFEILKDRRKSNQILYWERRRRKKVKNLLPDNS